jgi:hypothetical protein
VKILELYEDEELILILKTKILNHDYTTKGQDHRLEILLLTYKEKTLKQQRVLAESNPQDVKK